MGSIPGRKVWGFIAFTPPVDLLKNYGYNEMLPMPGSENWAGKTI